MIDIKTLQVGDKVKYVRKDFSDTVNWPKKAGLMLGMIYTVDSVFNYGAFRLIDKHYEYNTKYDQFELVKEPELTIKAYQGSVDCTDILKSELDKYVTKRLRPGSVLEVEDAGKIVNMYVDAKTGDGKLDWTLLPYKALEKVVEVLEFGGKKYPRDSWKAKTGNYKQRYLAALIRHCVEMAKGNMIDPESGKPHAAHAACNALFLTNFEIKEE